MLSCSRLLATCTHSYADVLRRRCVLLRWAAELVRIQVGFTVFSVLDRFFIVSAGVPKIQCRASVSWRACCLHHAASSRLRTQQCSWLSMSIGLCIGREASFGHGILRVAANGTTMSWEWHRNQDGVPVITDKVTLTRDTKACPARGTQAKPATPVPNHIPDHHTTAHVCQCDSGRPTITYDACAWCSRCFGVEWLRKAQMLRLMAHLFPVAVQRLTGPSSL